MSEYDFHPAFKDELKNFPKKFVDIFPEEKIKEIAKIMRIQKKHLNEFREFLLLTSSHYLANKISSKNKIKNNKSIEQFEKIERQANKLIKSIEALEKLMKELYWSHLSEIAASGIKSKSNSNIPPLYFVTRIGDEVEAYLFPINDQRVLEVVEYLGIFANSSRKKISKDKGGRNENEALFLLVSSCRLFLTNLRNKEVAKPRTTGLLAALQDLTEAICVRLDPSIKEGALTTAIRATGKMESARKGNNRGKKFPS